jgi:hypothetical protein
MRRAIALTANCPQLPFGALIVSDETGEVVAEGWNESALNLTRHGEIDAINHLAESGRSDGGPGLVLYTTAESCPKVPGGHPLERHRHGGVRFLDPLPAAAGLAADRHPRRRSGAPEPRMGMCDHRRRARTGVQPLVRVSARLISSRRSAAVGRTPGVS